MAGALLKWTTEYDRVNNLVIHRFSGIITVVHNKTTDEVKTLKDGVTIDRREYIKQDFDRYLNRVFAEVEKLKEFAV